MSAVHLPGSENVEADVESRTSSDLEWKLDLFVFQDILSCLGQRDVDLFASRGNAQLQRYVSWLPDPDAYAFDAFGLNWSEFTAFCFPPFSLVPKVLQRLELTEGEEYGQCSPGSQNCFDYWSTCHACCHSDRIC